jgi:hypothetical protein
LRVARHHACTRRQWGQLTEQHLMSDVIAVIAAGEMGSGIGKRLTERARAS